MYRSTINFCKFFSIALLVLSAMFLFDGVFTSITAANAQSQQEQDLTQLTERELRQFQNQIRSQQSQLQRQQSDIERDHRRAVSQLQSELRRQEREVRRDLRDVDRAQTRLQRDYDRTIRNLERDLARAERDATSEVRKLERKLSWPNFIQRLLRRGEAELQAIQSQLLEEQQEAEAVIQQLRQNHQQAVEQVDQQLLEQTNFIEQQRSQVNEQVSTYRQAYQSGVEQLDGQLLEDLSTINQQNLALNNQIAEIVTEQQRRENPPPSPVCGNNQVESGEQCDDGNTQNNDGCDSQCQLELIIEEEPSSPPSSTVCGNGLIEPGEQCDDGNNINNDGCDVNCLVTTTPQPEPEPDEPESEPSPQPVIEIQPEPNPQIIPEPDEPEPDEVEEIDDGVTVACEAGGREMPLIEITNRLGISSSLMSYTPITETSILAWANQDQTDPSGDIADIIASMQQLDQACTTGALSYVGIDALIQAKFLTGLGWPVELSLGFEPAVNPLDQTIEHVVIATSMTGPNTSGGYQITAVDPNGPQVVTLTCTNTSQSGYLCSYAGANGQEANAVPALRQNAEGLLSTLTQVFKQTCDVAAGSVPNYCSRKPIASWLATNFPNIDNTAVSGTSLTGGCSGWVGFVYRVAFLGDFVGECSEDVMLNPAPRASMEQVEADEDQSSLLPSERFELLPLPATAYPDFAAECPNIAVDEEVCRVWPKGCSDQSFTCCEACQYDGANPGQCTSIGPKNYELVCQCASGETKTMFHRRDEFNKNPDCSLSIETFILTQCQPSGSDALGCPCAENPTVSCSGSETIPARTCTIDALGNRFGDCSHIPERITDPFSGKALNLRPNEAVQSFATRGSVLGSSTFDFSQPLLQLSWHQQIWDWILFQIGL